MSMHGCYEKDYGVTMVYVDSYENNVLCGRFANPYLKGIHKFTSLADFIVKMEGVINIIDLPETCAADCGYRKNFHDSIIMRGKKDTFSINIRFRQNDSWQGTISWLETNHKQNFRSVLELILLLDSALREPNIPSEKINSPTIV